MTEKICLLIHLHSHYVCSEALYKLEGHWLIVTLTGSFYYAYTNIAPVINSIYIISLQLNLFSSSV